MSLQVIYKNLSENTVILINFFKHINLVILNNIKKFHHTKVNKFIDNFLFNYVDSFIFYKVNN